MKVTTTLPFLIAKAKADMGNSPSHSLIYSILGVDSIGEIENMMASTSYGDVFTSHRPSKDIIEFEGGLRRHFAKKLLSFRRNASPKVRDMIDAIIVLIEADNLKLIFRSIISKEQDEEILSFIIPVNKYGFNHYRRMFQVASAELATDLIAFKELKRAVRNALSHSGTEEEMLFYITSYLEHEAYSFIYKQSKSFKTILDMQNLMTVCRASLLDIDPTQWIIPNKGIVANNIEVLKRYSSPREILNWVLYKVPFTDYLVKALEAPNDDQLISTLEKQIELAFIRKNRQMFAIFTTQVESIWSYFELKKAEMNDISRVILGKVTGLEVDTIRNALTYYI